METDYFRCWNSVKRSFPALNLPVCDQAPSGKVRNTMWFVGISARGGGGVPIDGISFLGNILTNTRIANSVGIPLCQFRPRHSEIFILYTLYSYVINMPVLLGVFF